MIEYHNAAELKPEHSIICRHFVKPVLAEHAVREFRDGGGQAVVVEPVAIGEAELARRRGGRAPRRRRRRRRGGAAEDRREKEQPRHRLRAGDLSKELSRTIPSWERWGVAEGSREDS